MSGVSFPPLPSWQVNLTVAAFVVAIVALGFSIWDKLKVAVWNVLGPVQATFDPELNPELDEQCEEIPAGAIDALRIRVTVRNRVDYRLKVVLGVALSRDLLERSSQEILDQIDGSLIADTTGSAIKGRMTLDVEAFQSRYVWLRLVLRSTTDGFASPGVTILASRRRGVRRVVKRAPFSVRVTWTGKIHRYARAPASEHQIGERATKRRG